MTQFWFLIGTFLVFAFYARLILASHSCNPRKPYRTHSKQPSKIRIYK